MEPRIEFNPPYVFDADAISIHLTEAGGSQWFSVNIGEKDTAATRIATVFCNFGGRLRVHLPEGQIIMLPAPEEAA